MKPKVRNPMGIHVHKRVAGKHGKTVKATRRKEKVATRKEYGGVIQWQNHRLLTGL